MPTRTYLTTPPGRTPSVAPGRSASGDERYVPGPAAPIEPRTPSRWRTPAQIAVVTVLVLLIVISVLRVVSAPAQDPSLPQGPDVGTETGDTGR